jgi:hypothetical protein
LITLNKPAAVLLFSTGNKTSLTLGAARIFRCAMKAEMRGTPRTPRVAGEGLGEEILRRLSVVAPARACGGRHPDPELKPREPVGKG